MMMTKENDSLVVLMALVVLLVKPVNAPPDLFCLRLTICRLSTSLAGLKNTHVIIDKFP